MNEHKPKFDGPFDGLYAKLGELDYTPEGLEAARRLIVQAAAQITGLSATDAAGLGRVCMSFQAEQLDKGDEIGRKFWMEQGNRLRRYAELAALAKEEKP